MSEVPLYAEGMCVRRCIPERASGVAQVLQGYLTHKKTPAALGPPQGPRHGLTQGPKGVRLHT